MLIRIVIGSAFFVSAVWVGIKILRGLARPVEDVPEIATADVEAADIRYRCSVCGMEIRITRSPSGNSDAPKHCGEAMVSAGESPER